MVQDLLKQNKKIKKKIEADKKFVDYERSTKTKIFIKNSDYCYVGNFKAITSNNNGTYIALVKYAITDKKNNVLTNYPKHNINSSVVINLNDVEVVQLFYIDDSEVWKWLNNNKD